MRFGMVRARDVASLVDEREREPAQLGGPLFGNLDAAGVGETIVALSIGTWLRT